VRDPQKLKPIPEPKTPEQLLGDCRISAMLVALATAEGTAADADGGYGRGVGGTVLKSPNNPALVGQTNVTITDFSQHPNILVQVNANLTSTAAGRYQFLYGTWSGLNLGDFGSHNQNVGAVMLLQQVGSIKPLLKGNVAQAVSNANGTWASLPGSPYGQPTTTITDFQNTYDRALQDCRNTPIRIR
jgi:muramidase (phage lysozyme)